MIFWIFALFFCIYNPGSWSSQQTSSSTKFCLLGYLGNHRIFLEDNWTNRGLLGGQRRPEASADAGGIGEVVGYDFL